MEVRPIVNPEEQQAVDEPGRGDTGEAAGFLFLGRRDGDEDAVVAG